MKANNECLAALIIDALLDDALITEGSAPLVKEVVVNKLDRYRQDTSESETLQIEKLRKLREKYAVDFPENDGTDNLDIFYTSQFVQNETCECVSSHPECRMETYQLQHCPVVRGTLTGQVYANGEVVEVFITNSDGVTMVRDPENPTGTFVSVEKSKAIYSVGIQHDTGVMTFQWNEGYGGDHLLVVNYEYNMDLKPKKMKPNFSIYYANQYVCSQRLDPRETADRKDVYRVEANQVPVCPGTMTGAAFYDGKCVETFTIDADGKPTIQCADESAENHITKLTFNHECGEFTEVFWKHALEKERYLRVSFEYNME